MLSATDPSRAPVETLQQVVVGVLGDAATLPLEPLGDPEWNKVFEEAGRHRIIGVLAAAVHAGQFPVTDEQHRQLSEYHHRLLAMSLEIEAGLLSLLGPLREGGIRPIILKGVAAAHIDYPQPWMRTFQDVDILIAAPDVPRAVEVIASCGYSRDLPPRTSRWDTRFAKDVTLASASGSEIDLHRTLIGGAHGFWLDLEDLTRRPQAFTIAGQQVHALSPASRSLHAALSLALADQHPRLSQAMDLVLAVRCTDADDLARLASASRAENIVHEALTTASTAFGASVLPPAHRVGPDTPRTARVQTMARAMYRTGGGSNTTTLLSGLLGIRGIADRVSYLRALVSPTKEYRDSRRRGARPAEWSAGIREIFRRGSG